MAEYRKGSHCVYSLHYHFVFIPKYRKPVLRGEVGVRVRELVRRVCHALDVEIVKGHVRPDHVHLLLSVPPTTSRSQSEPASGGSAFSRLTVEIETPRL
jgi:putative transposase